MRRAPWIKGSAASRGLLPRRWRPGAARGGDGNPGQDGDHQKACQRPQARPHHPPAAKRQATRTTVAAHAHRIHRPERRATAPEHQDHRHRLPQSKENQPQEEALKLMVGRLRLNNVSTRCRGATRSTTHRAWFRESGRSRREPDNWDRLCVKYLDKKVYVFDREPGSRVIPEQATEVQTTSAVVHAAINPESASDRRFFGHERYSEARPKTGPLSSPAPRGPRRSGH